MVHLLEKGVQMTKAKTPKKRAPRKKAAPKPTTKVVKPRKSRKKSRSTGKKRGPYKFTPARQTKFLDQLTEFGVIGLACKAASIDRSTILAYRAEDPQFARAFDDAMELHLDKCEHEAYIRGVVGWLEPVFFQGHQTGVVRKFSDQLLMFRLKGRRRKIFGDKTELKIKGKGDRTARDLTRQEREKRIAELIDKRNETVDTGESHAKH